MAFIKKRIVRGKAYYSLVTKIKRNDGKWGIKTLKSYGDQYPLLETNTGEVKDNRLTEKQDNNILETKRFVVTKNTTVGDLWDFKIKRWKKYLETKQ